VTLTAYPAVPVDRTRWILSRRGSPNLVTEEKPSAFFVESERAASGAIEQTATIFLTNRECPWKCVMCDLWRNTTVSPVSPGSITRQIEFALSQLPSASVLKLYNSGSFFDSGAVSPSEWSSVARLCRSFRHVIVENHPRLVGAEVLRFRELLEGTFEIAMGLETCHPKALDALNKRISLDVYYGAAEFLNRNGIAVRTFLLLNPPFISASEQNFWLRKSIQAAFQADSSVVSLIPTRSGNGALDDLARLGLFQEPTLGEIELAQEYGISEKRGRVFADTWDLERFSCCRACFAPRSARIAGMNLTQKVEPRIRCPERECCH
jgi:archaeosine synthase beta-subunit